MYPKILATADHKGYALLRITLGGVMIAHGLQKAFGCFGGYGWQGTMDYFTGTVGLPAVFGAGVILIESLGAFLLMIGLAGRIQAGLLGAVMLGALWVDHLPNGFYMNWFSNQKGEGVEFDLLFLAIAAVLTLYGSGAWSVDRWMVKNIEYRTRNKE